MVGDRAVALVGTLALGLSACGGGPAPRSAATTAVPTTRLPATAVVRTAAATTVEVETAPVAPVTAPPPATSAAREVVEVRYRIENRSPDAGLAAFADDVERTLTDPRGWQRAHFRLLRDPAARYAVILAEPDEAHELCRPYDIYRRYSCQNGPHVVLNADRWRSATPQWTGDVATYRQMVVNHEFGHLLGMRHPAVHCPQPGQPAGVMAQQSTELDGCLPNPWPLPHEIARADRHDQKLAPAYGE